MNGAKENSLYAVRAQTEQKTDPKSKDRGIVKIDRAKERERHTGTGINQLCISVVCFTATNAQSKTAVKYYSAYRCITCLYCAMQGERWDCEAMYVCEFVSM